MRGSVRSALSLSSLTAATDSSECDAIERIGAVSESTQARASSALVSLVPCEVHQTVPLTLGACRSRQLDRQGNDQDREVDGIADWPMSWERDRDGGFLLNTAQADAGAYEAQLHQLQADLQQREQQVADTQRLQHAQQQMQDIQREEIQRKEQQVVGQQHQLQQQQQADMHLREQQVTEQQHQLQQQQQADMHLREQQVAEQHQLLQADMHLREKQVAEQQHQLQLQQQLNRLQQQLEAQ
ncbi:hypothetical protein QJQ45_030511, partial [Haematococcus lacustris]